MNTKITFGEKSYIKEVRNEDGELSSRKEIDNSHLAGEMEQLVKIAEPNNHEVLLKFLRSSYKLFKPKNFTFKT